MEIQSGVIADPRPQEAKAKDYLHIAGAVTPNWQTKTSYKRFNQRNQDGSFSCVFQSGAKALEVLTGKVISATPYFWRKNYPQEGSFLQDMGDIMYNRYSCLESVSPSQNQSEVQMNVIKPLTTNIGCTGYRTIQNPNDIELIAEAIEAYGQCVILFSSNSNEWQVTPQYLGGTTTFNHAICAVDYSLINGVKTLICEDSAGQWSSFDGLRLITQDYLSKRAFGAMYFLGAKDTTVPQDNKFQFLKDLKYGMTDPDVGMLQMRLDMPSNLWTSYFGWRTQAAVIKYQLTHGIIPTGYVGKITRSSLNS